MNVWTNYVLRSSILHVFAASSWNQLQIDLEPEDDRTRIRDSLAPELPPLNTHTFVLFKSTVKSSNQEKHKRKSTHHGSHLKLEISLYCQFRGTDI